MPPPNLRGDSQREDDMSGTNSNQPDNQRPGRLGDPEGFCKPAGEAVSTERSEPVALAAGERSEVATASPAAAPPAASPSTRLEDQLPAAPRLTGRGRGRRLVKPVDPPAALEPGQRLLLLDTWRRSGLPARDFAALVGLSLCGCR